VALECAKHGDLHMLERVLAHRNDERSFDPALWARAGEAGQACVLAWLLARAARLTTGDASIVDLRGIGDDDAVHLAAALMADCTVKSLWLRGSQIGDEGCECLAAALKVNETITDLNLEANLFGALGTSHLAEALRVNTTLTKLELGSNMLGNVGITYLAEALKVNTALNSLGVAYNGIGAVGVQHLADALTVRKAIAPELFALAGLLNGPLMVGLDLQLNHLTLDSDGPTLDLLRQAWGDRPGLYL
jgi:hypothetical protein